MDQLWITAFEDHVLDLGRLALVRAGLFDSSIWSQASSSLTGGWL
jgi:hypothetical protein